MKKHLPNIDIVIVSLSKIKIGLYKDSILFEEIETNEKTSEYLPKIYNELIKKYNIERIVYSRGPGSFMSLKLTYVFLKTLNISKNIKLFACDGFVFTNNSPIKAMGNLYFVKENGKISLKKFENEVETQISLPKNINLIKYDENIEPLYILPAV
ncbi:hypothetical protein [Nitrosophilus kaiyonis]|uniref:hypothetical protein n=1 Tax=Nitrosophilus kaiyonis TaxID=2930200 RepID=UPI00249378E5|nr:hypothetical protein [Nitrosophilus kaiyonis]